MTTGLFKRSFLIILDTCRTEHTVKLVTLRTVKRMFSPLLVL